MIDHVSVPVRDLERAIGFYKAALSPLGMQCLVIREYTAGFGKRYPEFWLNLRADLTTVSDPGAHVALRAVSKCVVQEFHSVAITLGGIDDGSPGPRHGERTNYFGAFIRDFDGNRIEVVTFPTSPIENAA